MSQIGKWWVRLRQINSSTMLARAAAETRWLCRDRCRFYSLRGPRRELRRLHGRHELECRLFGRCRWLARLRYGYLDAVFCLHGVAAREQLSALGDVSCLDTEVLAIDVQDGVAIGQQVF